MEAKGDEGHVSEGPWGRVAERLEEGRHQVAIKVALEAVLLWHLPILLLRPTGQEYHRAGAGEPDKTTSEEYEYC